MNADPNVATHTNGASAHNGRATYRDTRDLAERIADARHALDDAIQNVALVGVELVSGKEEVVPAECNATAASLLAYVSCELRDMALEIETGNAAKTEPAPAGTSVYAEHLADDLDDLEADLALAEGHTSAIGTEAIHRAQRAASNLRHTVALMRSDAPAASSQRVTTTETERERLERAGASAPSWAQWIGDDLDELEEQIIIVEGETKGGSPEQAARRKIDARLSSIRRALADMRLVGRSADEEAEAAQ